jgi:predicted HAD superfamily Cof-like phosphohydrolase
MIPMIEMWHEKARPVPNDDHLRVQTGVHFEEACEMLAAMRGADEYSDVMLDRLHTAMTVVALGMKQGHIKFTVCDREDFLDSLCDQIVTAVGVGHCAGMNMSEGVRRVNASNWSKFKHGKPEFDQNGKIDKPDTYLPPNLEGLY